MRPALLTGLLLPFVSAPEFTGVTVEEGTEVTKTFENSIRLELVDMSVTVGGEDIGLPSPTVIIEDDEEIVFVDTYVKVGDGRALELNRTFETLEDFSSQSITPPDSDEEIEEIEEGESVFQDRSVRFVWDADEEDYVATLVGDDDLDEDLMAELDGDADFLFLLSDEPMEEGSSWDIDVEAFSKISSPSGDLQIVDPDADESMDERFSEAFDENLVGDLTGTVESIEDGIVKILISGEISTEFEMEFDGEGDGPTQGFSFTFEMEGELLWSLEAGRATELSLEGDVEMTVTLSGETANGELVQTQLFEGTQETSATFE